MGATSYGPSLVPAAKAIEFVGMILPHRSAQVPVNGVIALLVPDYGHPKRWPDMAKRASKAAKHVGFKVVLRLPELDQVKSAVLNSLASPESQRGYRQGMEQFIAWYCSEPRLSFNRIVVNRYRFTWSPDNWRRGLLM